MGLSAAERETIYSIDDESGTWAVYSARRKDITKLKKNPDLVIIEEGVFDGTPFLRGTLVEGGISARAKSAGSIKRGGPKREGMPTNAVRCTGTKLNGDPCGSIASKETGRCKRHPL
jgi:hypothetical protein